MNRLSKRNINLICGFLKQKSFHEDVVKVIHSNLEEEEILPEDQRPTSLARSYYLTVRFLLFLFDTKVIFTQPVRIAKVIWWKMD